MTCMPAAVSRRRLPVLLAGLLAACAAPPSAVPWREVADGVWVWPPGVDGARDGPVAPVTAVIDAGEAIVIDPGHSHAQGLRVRESLRNRFGARVVGVVNTHAHAERVLGNSAFAGGPWIAASTPAMAAMRRRCEACLREMVARRGEAAMAGTRVVWPNRALVGGDVLRVGRRTLHVLEVVQAHSEGDLLLWDARARVLWAGDVVDGTGVPELVQGSLRGWLQALDGMAGWPARHVVGTAWWPTGGAVMHTAAFAATRHYLRALHDAVWRALEEGRLPHEAEAGPVPGDAARRERHALNVQHALRELEPLWMDAHASAAQDVGW